MIKRKGVGDSTYSRRTPQLVDFGEVAIYNSSCKLSRKEIRDEVVGRRRGTDEGQLRS